MKVAGIAADNFSTGSRDNLLAHVWLQSEELDIVNEPERLETLIREADTVVHLAAAVGVEMVVDNPVHTIMTNVQGSENVLEPAAKYRKRIIIESAREAYGKSENGLFNEHDDLRLGSPCHSCWSYACSKLLDNFLPMAYVQSVKLPGTIVRFFNTVGTRFVRAALAEKIVATAGFNGNISRDSSKNDSMYPNPMGLSKARALGWKPLITLDEGIKQTIQEYSCP